VALAESEPSVGSVSAYRLNGTRVDLVNLPDAQSTEDGRAVVSLIGAPTAVLYRADIVRSRRPFLDEAVRHSDADAGYWTLLAPGLRPRSSGSPLQSFTRGLGDASEQPFQPAWRPEVGAAGVPSPLRRADGGRAPDSPELQRLVRIARILLR
jgi:hypothetical protein